MLGDVPRLRITCGDFLGDFVSNNPFSLSGDGELTPPDAEFLRDDPIRTSKWRNRSVTSFFESSVLLNKKANGQDIHDDSLKDKLLVRRKRKLWKCSYWGGDCTVTVVPSPVGEVTSIDMRGVPVLLMAGL